MKVDFNNLRKQSVYSLNRLIKTLNNSIYEVNGYIETKNDSITCDKAIVLDPEELSDKIEELSTYIGLIAACFEEGNPNYQDVYSDILGGIVEFNSDIQ